MIPADSSLLRDWLRSECARLDYVWFEGGPRRRPFDLNIIAIRMLPGQPDRFDDYLTCSYLDHAGQWTTDMWPITTDPGLHWLRNPGKVEGTAILAPGQYRSSHEVGEHKGQYPALVQSGGSVTVIRDSDRDGDLDYGGYRDTGFFGINIHASDSNPFNDQDPNPAHLVGRWSAGCLVFAFSADYREWWGIVLRSAASWGERFSLTLLETHCPPPGLARALLTQPAASRAD